MKTTAKSPKRKSRKNTSYIGKDKNRKLTNNKTQERKKNRKKRPVNIIQLSRDKMLEKSATDLNKITDKESSKTDIKRYFDIIPVITVALDSKGKILILNPRGCELLGYKENEIIGKNWFDTVIPPRNRDKLQNTFKEIISGNLSSLEYYENPVIRKNKTEVLIVWRNSLITDETGKITGTISSGVDITERRNKEEELKSWKERYEIVADASGQIVYFYEIENGRISWSGKVERVLGYTKKEMGDINDWVKKIHKEDRDEALRLLDAAQNNVSVYDVEYRFRHKKGNFVIMHDKGIFIPGADGKAVNMVGMMQDVTEFRNQQEKIRENEKTLKTFIDAVVDPLFMINKEGIALYVNKAIADNFKMTPEELVGKNVYELLPAEIASKRKKINNKVFETGKSVRYEDARGGEFFNNFIYPVFDDKGKVRNIAILSSDITEKKKSEISLLENQKRLAETEKFSLVMVTYAGLDGKWFKVPPSLCDLLGYTEEELLRSNFNDITHPDDIERDLKECEKLIKGENKSFHLEKRYIRKNGSVVWVYINCSVVLDEKKKPVHFMTYIKDITDRKNAEEALKKKEELLSKITNTASDAIVLLDNDGKVIFWNPAAEEMFGYTKQEMTGKELHSVLAPSEFFGDYKKGFGLFKHTGQGIAIDKTLEFTAVKKNGTKFPIEVSTSAMKVDGKWNATGFIRDITERKKAEELIQSSLKEKEILLREIHHRVKNNLQVISSLLSIQSEKLVDEDARRAFKESQHRIKSIAKVHEKLYQSEKISEIDFNDYVDSLTKELMRTFGEYADNIYLKTEIENVKLTVDYAVPCGLIINEAVSNSLNYAFPESIMKNRKCEIFIRMKSKGNGNIELIIEDNGIGLPKIENTGETEGMGLHLIKILAVGQLKGDLKTERDNGTKHIVNFKMDE